MNRYRIEPVRSVEWPHCRYAIERSTGRKVFLRFFPGCEDSSFPAFLPTSVTMSSALTLWTGGGGTLGRTGPSTSPE